MCVCDIIITSLSFYSSWRCLRVALEDWRRGGGRERRRQRGPGNSCEQSKQRGAETRRHINRSVTTPTPSSNYIVMSRIFSRERNCMIARLRSSTGRQCVRRFVERRRGALSLFLTWTQRLQDLPRLGISISLLNHQLHTLYRVKLTSYPLPFSLPSPPPQPPFPFPWVPSPSVPLPLPSSGPLSPLPTLCRRWTG